MFLVSAMLTAVVAAGQPVRPEVEVLAEGPGWLSASFSPGCDKIAGIQRLDPERRGQDVHWKIAIWSLPDDEGASQRAVENREEERRNVAPVARAVGRHPTEMVDLNDCKHPCRVCFAPDGRVAVLALESRGNGYMIRGPRATLNRAATEDEARVAKAAGRRISPFCRFVILFLNSANLQEESRWVDGDLHGTDGLHAKLFWFPEAKTAINFSHDAVRLLDDSTGEEFERLMFDQDSRNDPWGISSSGDARVIPPNGRTGLIVATSRHRHAIWKLSADRKVTKIAEVAHPGMAAAAAISPSGRFLALAAMPANYKWGRKAPDEDPWNGESAIEIWQVESQKVSKALTYDGKSVFELQFSPDGKRLAAVGSDMAMVVWDVATGEQLLRRSLDGVGYIVQFSNDGSQLLTAANLAGDNKGTRICVWDVGQMLKSGKSSPKRPKL